MADLDHDMLLLGRPMLRFTDNGGWFSSNEQRAEVQVSIHNVDRGYVAHVWFHTGNGDGQIVNFFSKKKPAKSGAEALERINSVLRGIREALKEAP